MKIFILFTLIFSFKAYSSLQDFKIFRNHQNAHQFIVEINKTSRTPFRIFPLRSKKYEKALRVIEEVMQGYRAVFPQLTYDLPDPFPIIVQNNSLNSFVFPHTLTKKGSPFVIMIFSGMFREEVVEDEFYAVMAHELAHLIFGHSKKEVLQKLETFYRVESGEVEPLGFKVPNDTFVERVVRGMFHAFNNKNTSYIENVKRNHKVETFRVYTTEEQADDASIRVLNFLGREPTSIGTFMLRWLSPEEKEKCLLSIKRGEQIPYGTLFDRHRGDCWRYDHSIRFAETL
jgi:hypothetical protein